MKNILKYILVAGFLALLVFLLVFKSNREVNKGEKINIGEEVNNNKINNQVNSEKNKIELNYNSYKSEITIGGATVYVDIVRTPEDQARGLSGREKLEEGQGMLFAFDVPDIYKFWMKDMKFSIDMIWIDENLKVIYIKENATPESYPQSFGPDQNASYVLEVVAGFSKKNNIQIGDKLVLQLPD